MQHLDPEADKYIELVPKEIENYVLEGETFERLYHLRDGTIYVTNRRLLMKKGHLIRDFSYDHIKSIEYKKCRQYVMLYGGIFLIILALGATQFFDIGWLTPSGLGVMSMGFIMFTVGLAPKSNIELKIAGQSLPLKILTAGEYELNSFYKLITERVT